MAMIISPLTGARGRTLKTAESINYGKAPAVIVDLKAAVRYLRYNDDIMPGDAEKIISDGTSAGGGVSTLLGATGNSKDYEPYLKAIGGANERDDLFAWADSIVSNTHAVPMTANIQIDKQAVAMEAYIINGSSYIKLRDLATAFSQSAKKFDVVYDPTINQMRIILNHAYTASGGELSQLSPKVSSQTIEVSNPFQVDEITTLITTANINANMYIKLQNLANILDFNLAYDAKSKTVSMDTTIGYGD